MIIFKIDVIIFFLFESVYKHFFYFSKKKDLRAYKFNEIQKYLEAVYIMKKILAVILFFNILFIYPYLNAGPNDKIKTQTIDTSAKVPAVNKTNNTVQNVDTNKASGDYEEIIIKHGDTLSSISEKYLQDSNKWQYISKFNNIENPNILEVNQKIKIPRGDLSKIVPDVKIQQTPTAKKKPADKRSKPTVKSTPSSDVFFPKSKPEPKLSAAEIERKQNEEFRQEILKFETQFNETIGRDNMIKSQKEYFQVLKTIEESKGELSLNHIAVAKELLEKAKITSEKIKINAQVETIILKTVKLVEFNGKVEIYYLKEQLWMAAASIAERSLRNGDKIRTGSLSGAVLTFEDGTQLSILANSEIEIKRSIFDIKNNTLYSRISILRGSAQFNSREYIPIKAVNEIECLESLAEFYGNLSTTLFQDGSIKYELYSGQAAIIARNEKRMMKSGSGLFVFPNAAPSAVSELLNQAQLFSPANNVYAKISTPELSWGSLAGAEYYLLQVAEDEAFNKLVYEETARQTKKKISALLDGKYFWRVIPVDKNGFNGFVRESRMFIIDTIAPRLALLSPKEDEIITDKYVKFHGLTEQGRTIKINNMTIIPDKNGEFTYSLPFKQGTNIIKLESSDNAGNITQMFRLFHIDYDLQLIHLNGKVYSTIPDWKLHSYLAQGEMIFNRSVYELKLGEFHQNIVFDKGVNNLSISINQMGYKEIRFVYDNDKPELKSLRVSPDVNEDNATLNFHLKAIDANSPLAHTAKIIFFEKEDTVKRYEIDLVYNAAAEEYFGSIQADRKIISKDLVLAYAAVSDIVGNTVYLSEEGVTYPGQPTLFWERIKTNYKQLGLPLFVVSFGGIFFSL